LNRPSPGQAAALGGASIAAAAIAIGVAQIELGGQPQPHVWSNSWLLVALSLAFAGLAIAVVFFVAAMFAREPPLSEDDDQAVGQLNDARQTTGHKAQPGEEGEKGLASGAGNVHSEIHGGAFYGPVVQGRDVVYGSPPARPPPPPEGPDTKPAR
jgi:hypothetical protein